MGLESLIGGEGFLTTTVNGLVNWGRKNALWPMPFGTACCAIEMMATFSGRYDISRFGAEVVRFSPRQSDLLIVSGRISIKMMPVLQKIVPPDARTEVGHLDGSVRFLRWGF